MLFECMQKLECVTCMRHDFAINIGKQMVVLLATVQNCKG